MVKRIFFLLFRLIAMFGFMIFGCYYFVYQTVYSPTNFYDMFFAGIVFGMGVQQFISSLPDLLNFIIELGKKILFKPGHDV